MTLQEEFGRIDIYVFDQLLRGNIRPGMRVLDAGCGHGRNLVYLLRHGFEIAAIDANPEAVESVRAMAKELQPGLPDGNLRVGAIEEMDFPDDWADVVLCNSVLHFSRDDAHWDAQVMALWRVLRPGGLLFVRLGSRIGMDFEPLGGNRFRTGLDDVWYLVDEARLMRMTAVLGGTLVDPLKTTVVQGQRCMTTWVLSKPA